MRKINKIINTAVIFIIIGEFLCLNAAYPSGMPCLRVPLNVNQARIEDMLNKISEPLLISYKKSPTSADNLNKHITLGTGGIVASHKSYTLSSAGISNMTCCFCIIKNTKTGNYAAAHIIGKSIHGIDYPYKNVEMAVSKMLSLLKTIDPSSSNKDLTAIIIGGGNYDEKIRQIAEKNHDNLKSFLESEGIAIAADEPVSLFEKDIKFSEANKIDISYIDAFYDGSAFAVRKQNSIYFTPPVSKKAVSEDAPIMSIRDRGSILILNFLIHKLKDWLSGKGGIYDNYNALSGYLEGSGSNEQDIIKLCQENLRQWNALLLSLQEFSKAWSRGYIVNFDIEGIMNEIRDEIKLNNHFIRKLREASEDGKFKYDKLKADKLIEKIDKATKDISHISNMVASAVSCNEINEIVTAFGFFNTVITEDKLFFDKTMEKESIIILGIIYNFARNSAKQTVITTRDGKWIKFEVHDTESGIPKELLRDPYPALEYLRLKGGKIQVDTMTEEKIPMRLVFDDKLEKTEILEGDSIPDDSAKRKEQGVTFTLWLPFSEKDANRYLFRRVDELISSVENKSFNVLESELRRKRPENYVEQLKATRPEFLDDETYIDLKGASISLTTAMGWLLIDKRRFSFDSDILAVLEASAGEDKKEIVKHVIHMCESLENVMNLNDEDLLLKLLQNQETKRDLEYIPGKGIISRVENFKEVAAKAKELLRIFKYDIKNNFFEILKLCGENPEKVLKKWYEEPAQALDLIGTKPINTCL